MDKNIINKVIKMSQHESNGEIIANSLSYLVMSCEIVVLSSNSNHIENDLIEALDLRKKLKRNNVLLACLVGSFTNDEY